MNVVTCDVSLCVCGDAHGMHHTPVMGERFSRQFGAPAMAVLKDCEPVSVLARRDVWRSKLIEQICICTKHSRH